MSGKVDSVNQPYIGGGGRIVWVDTAKALGLFLVFWGHLLYGGSICGTVINRAIYSFHMPMYFLISGLIAKGAPEQSIVEYIKIKFYRVLLPALILYILTLPVYFLSVDYKTESLQAILLSVFYISGHCAYNAPVWFFFCMFQVLVVSRLLGVFNAKTYKLIVVLLLALIISYLSYDLKWRFFNLFGINKCLLGMSFFIVGILLRRLNYVKGTNTIGLIALPIWIITGVIYNIKVNMYSMELGNFWLFVVSGITGSLVFCGFSKMIEKVDTIRRYAKWTIFIVCSHYLFVSLFGLISSFYSIEGTWILDVSSALFVCLSLWLYKPICIFLETRIPIVFGLRKCNS